MASMILSIPTENLSLAISTYLRISDPDSRACSSSFSNAAIVLRCHGQVRDIRNIQVAMQVQAQRDEDGRKK